MNYPRIKGIVNYIRNSIAVIIICNQIIIAQVETLFENDFHLSGYEQFKSVIQTSDSGFICLGEVNPFELDDTEPLIIKYNKYGEILWHKTIPLEGTNSYLNAGIEMKSFYGDLLVVGKNENDVMVLRLDSEGNQKWKRIFDYDGYLDGPASVLQSMENNFVICAVAGIQGDNYLDLDTWLFSLNHRGDMIWSKTYDLGYLYNELPRGFVQCSDSGYAIVGVEHFPREAPHEEAFLFKVDKNGEFLWHKFFGSDGYDEMNDIIELEDQNLILCGTYDSGTDSDLWLLKTDELGDSIWSKEFGGNQTEIGRSISSTNDNGCIITGISESYSNGSWDMWVVRTDSQGELQWHHNYGGEFRDYGNDVIKTMEGDYISVGEYSSTKITHDSTRKESYNGYIIRLSEPLVGINREPKIYPIEFSLEQNYPNPFNNGCVIQYSIPEHSNVELKVYDVLGREVAELINKEVPAGSYDVHFDASNLGSGIYFYQIRAGSFTRSKKMILLK